MLSSVLSSVDLALFIFVLVWDTSSSFLKPLLTCGIVSQGAGGVVASAEYSLEGGNFQPFFMAVRESDECGVETWRTRCEGRGHPAACDATSVPGCDACFDIC